GIIEQAGQITIPDHAGVGLKLINTEVVHERAGRDFQWTGPLMTDRAQVADGGRGGLGHRTQQTKLRSFQSQNAWPGQLAFRPASAPGNGEGESVVNNVASGELECGATLIRTEGNRVAQDRGRIAADRKVMIVPTACLSPRHRWGDAAPVAILRATE